LENKVTIFHVVPAMQIGGVETAIFKSYFELNKSVDYQVYTLKGRSSFEIQTKSLWSFLKSLIFNKPDLVITSLWASHPLGWLCKIIGIKWVPFFHNASFSHFKDKIGLLITSWLTDTYLADSESTAKFMVRNRDKLVYVVPYIFNYNRQVDYLLKDIDFIWIGRNNIQKRIDLLEKFIVESLLFFENIKVKVLIGGDRHESIEKLIDFNEILDLEIIYNSSNQEVLNLLDRSKVYLLFSDYEGMSMTTIEAIQSLCFPVVRPVGEISFYLNHSNAIFINNLETFQELFVGIQEILDNDKLRLLTCKKNKETINMKEGYIESMLRAIENLV
jgi:glycosyltransferase involved in cell wall biosynthesis